MSDEAQNETAGVPQPNDGDASVPALPAPDDCQTVELGGTPVKLDSLGPIIINLDGTTSRIVNWSTLSPQEQAVALRRIAKRNKERRTALEGQEERQS